MRIINDTLADKVSLALREQIVSGQLPAGTPLRQEELSSRFGVSMGALREAFRTLQKEGLVTIQPRRGVSVSTLSASEARELFEIRAFLELGALELALPNQKERDWENAATAQALVPQTQDPAEWPKLNWRFHESLYRPAGRPKLLSMIRSLHDNIDRYARFYMETMNFYQTSQDEHEQLLDACRSRNLARARDILSGHMNRASKQLILYLSREETDIESLD